MAVTTFLERPWPCCCWIAGRRPKTLQIKAIRRFFSTDPGQASAGGAKCLAPRTSGSSGHVPPITGNYVGGLNQAMSARFGACRRRRGCQEFPASSSGRGGTASRFYRDRSIVPDGVGQRCSAVRSRKFPGVVSMTQPMSCCSSSPTRSSVGASGRSTASREPSTYRP